MIQRRTFLGSMAAFCVASGSAARFAQASSLTPMDLNWECQVIETLPHNQAQRPPVVTGVSLQETGDLLAIVGDDHLVCLYDLRQRTYVRQLDRHTDWVRATRFSPDGTFLATAGNDRTLCLWDTRDWERPAMVNRHSEAISFDQRRREGVITETSTS